jgi:hypothetical protein
MKMSENVADKLGEKLPAEAIQCSPTNDGEHLECMATNNSSNRKFFDKDWEIEVDGVAGRDVEIMSHNQFINTTSIKPAGGDKECMPVLGNGQGKVTLVCREEGDSFRPEERQLADRPDSFEEALEDRGLEYEKSESNTRDDFRR